MTPAELESFLDGYCEAMVWANVSYGSNGRSTRSEDVSDLSAETVRLMREDAAVFASTPKITALLNRAVAGDRYSWRSAGFDYAMARNGHGVGFHDRGIDGGSELYALAQGEDRRYLYADQGQHPLEWVYEPW